MHAHLADVVIGRLLHQPARVHHQRGRARPSSSKRHVQASCEERKTLETISSSRLQTCWRNFRVKPQGPKGPCSRQMLFSAVLSTEGRVVGLCWAKLKPKRPKGSERKHGLSTEQFPVSAYVGSSNNLKDLKGVVSCSCRCLTLGPNMVYSQIKIF